MYWLIAYDKLLTHRTVVKELRRAVFSPQAAPSAADSQPWIPPRLESIEEAADGNVSVYSGYEPFVGFGLAVDGWSFALPLIPATDPQGLSGGRRDIVPFTTVELIDRVRSRLQA